MGNTIYLSITESGVLLCEVRYFYYHFLINCGRKVASVMKLIDILDEQKHSYLLSKYKDNIKHHPTTKTAQKASKERLSASDLEELMGINRQTYKRVNGRVRRK